MSGRAALVVVLLLATSPLALAAPEAGPAGRHDTLLVSLRSEPPGNSGNGYDSALSADGRVVAFDDGRVVLARDLATRTTTLVSRASGPDGAPARAGQFRPNLGSPDISADGRLVAFVSSAPNLDPDDTREDLDVYVRDLAAQTTTLVSRASGVAGVKGDSSSLEPSISADGRFVAFQSFANNLAPGDSETAVDFPSLDVYVRDLVTNETTLASRASGAAGADANDASTGPSLSADGRFVAFESSATNLHPDDGDDDNDVFVRDLTDGTTRLVSARQRGAFRAEPAISADGRYVAFAGAVGSRSEVYRADLVAGRTALVSRANGRGGAPSRSLTGEPAISADGSRVAFQSYASLLQPFPTGFLPDIYLRDVVRGTTTLVSRASGEFGEPGDGGSHGPAISADGRFVSFESRSANLHPRDRDRSGDVLVRDLGPGAPRPAPRVTCAGRRATIVMLRSSPAVTATRRADVVAGSPGADRVTGGAGRDRICARAGADVIMSADSARDVVRCGAGRDRVLADRRDRLFGCERRRIRG